MNTDIYQKNDVWHRAAVPPTKNSTITRRWLLVVAAVSLVFIALVIGYSLGCQPVSRLHHQISGLTQVNTHLQAQIASLTHDKNSLTTQINQLTACSDGKTTIQQVQAFLGRSQYQTAADISAAALTRRTNPLCPASHNTIAGLWYQSSIQAIITTPRPDFPDLHLQQQVVAEWQSVEEQADQFGVPPDKRSDAISIATLATNSGWWSLANAAWLKAYKQGTVGAEGISLRYSLLRNEGHELAFKGTPQMREQAIKDLATAHAIAKKYNLPNDPACSDLEKLGYPNCNSTTPDQSDPLLTSKSGS